MTETGYATTPDGRTVAFEDGGDPSGYPVLGLHGTPGCRYARLADDGVYARAGVRYVTSDRPGYGLSSRSPGRRVADAAVDAMAVADALALGRFGVTGGSGGGPHALACAALLPDRVERVSCLAGIAPFGDGGLPRDIWLEGMDADNIEEVGWALGGRERLEAELPGRQAAMEAALDIDPSGLLGTDVAAPDREFLLRPEVVTVFRRVVAEQCRNGVGGWVDDDLAFHAPWGFDLGAVETPVLLVWGEQDRSVPVAHREHLRSRLRNSHVVIDVAGGHMPRAPEAEVAMNMAWLVAGVLPEGSTPSCG